MHTTIRALIIFAALAACEAEPWVDDGSWDETETGIEVEGTWAEPSVDDGCDTRPGSIGCACPASGCLENLECLAGFCGPCPAEQHGCECGPGGTCEAGLACTDGVCVTPMSKGWQ